MENFPKINIFVQLGQRSFLKIPFIFFQKKFDKIKNL